MKACQSQSSLGISVVGYLGRWHNTDATIDSVDQILNIISRYGYDPVASLRLLAQITSWRKLFDAAAREGRIDMIERIRAVTGGWFVNQTTIWSSQRDIAETMAGYGHLELVQKYAETPSRAILLRAATNGHWQIVEWCTDTLHRTDTIFVQKMWVCAPYDLMEKFQRKYYDQSIEQGWRKLSSLDQYNTIHQKCKNKSPDVMKYVGIEFPTDGSGPGLKYKSRSKYFAYLILLIAYGIHEPNPNTLDGMGIKPEKVLRILFLGKWISTARIYIRMHPRALDIDDDGMMRALASTQDYDFITEVVPSIHNVGMKTDLSHFLKLAIPSGDMRIILYYYEQISDLHGMKALPDQIAIAALHIRVFDWIVSLGWEVTLSSALTVFDNRFSEREEGLLEWFAHLGYLPTIGWRIEVHPEMRWIVDSMVSASKGDIIE